MDSIMNRYLGVIIGFSIILLVPAWNLSCTGSKEITAVTQGEDRTPIPPRIIFLNYSLERDSLQGTKIELLQKIVSNGMVKPAPHPHSTGKSGDLRCITLDARQQPISDLLIPDPLTKRIEYIMEDNSLASRQIKLDHAEFSVRLQLDSACSFVSIERIDPSGNTPLIITEIDPL